MKHITFARPLPRRLAVTCFAVLVLGPGAARAAECPESSPTDPQERRTLAKEWFGYAEAAEKSGDDSEATRDYACSYKMVAHPFTAYNLGRVAERSGDNELALKMFKAYLTLKPDAQDREDVKAKVKDLEEKMAARTEGTTPEPSPTPSEESTEPPVQPPQEALTPPPEPKPAPVVQISKPVQPEPQPHSHVLPWVIGGASAAALVGGFALNLAARSKMSACRADADKGNNESANAECNSARPLAYTSYALFGVAAVGVAVDATLLILRHGSGGASSSDEEGDDDSSVGFLVLPGGGGLTARGRF